ncbi:hypothetical protein IT570_14080 [Candidatus Sumerlaeota bacterium]|nr:hypothetical protein [Candidatus Sumerlaeota bacterium]
MRRSFRSLLVGAILCAAPSAFAHYYGWLPGSSTDSPESGNRIAIVNLHTNAPAGPSNGFQFTDESAGADPLPPTFSPDGTYAYVLVGGVESPGASLNAFVYVFNANDVNHEVENFNPAPPTLQKITIPTDNVDDAVEPTGITMSPANNKVIVTEGAFNKVYIWSTITSGPNRGQLDDANRTVINTVNSPSSAWISKNGTRAYFCTNQVLDDGDLLVQSKVHVVDLTLPTPAIIASVDIPAPTQGPGGFGGAIKTVPFASCAFELKAGAAYTVAQPPGDPEDTIQSDAILYIFSGYAGFSGKLLGNPVVLNDPFNVYKFDTATNTFTADGNPRFSVTPGATQVTFPPLLSVYRTGHGSTNIQAAGSTRFEDEEGNEPKTIAPTNSDYLFLNGMLTPNGSQFYFGSASGADGTSLLLGTYSPLQQTSSFYNIGGHAAVTNIPSLAPSTNGTTQRSLTTIVGFTPYVSGAGTLLYDMIVAATDGFFGFNVPNGTDVSVPRKTQVLRYRLQNSTVQSTINLDIVAGAYTQQPIGKVPLGSAGRVEIANHLLGIQKLGLGSDVNHDTVIDATDISYLALQ